MRFEKIDRPASLAPRVLAFQVDQERGFDD
jgi:hypothetical protein